MVDKNDRLRSERRRRQHRHGVGQARRERYLKQVVVMRRDLSMPHGKLATMAAHASRKFILDRLHGGPADETMGRRLQGWFSDDEVRWMTELEPGLENLKQQSMATIVVFCADYEELRTIETQARQRGLTVGTVHDAGYAHNPPGTFVGIAVGPHWPEEFEGLTSHLKVR